MKSNPPSSEPSKDNMLSMSSRSITPSRPESSLGIREGVSPKQQVLKGDKLPVCRWVPEEGHCTVGG